MIVVSGWQVTSTEPADDDLPAEIDEEYFVEPENSQKNDQPEHLQKNMYIGLHNLDGPQLQMTLAQYFEDALAHHAAVEPSSGTDTPDTTMKYDPSPPLTQPDRGTLILYLFIHFLL